MPQIGHFKRQGDSFSGRVHTFTLDLELTVVPAESGEVENSPDYRVLRGDDDGRDTFECLTHHVASFACSRKPRNWRK